MSCNCAKGNKRIQEEQRHKDLINGTIQSVSLEVLQQRREACRTCPLATKNPNPKYAKFGGLTNLSKCKRTDRLLLSALKDPEYKCPEKLFKQ